VISQTMVCSLPPTYGSLQGRGSAAARLASGVVSAHLRDLVLLGVGVSRLAGGGHATAYAFVGYSRLHNQCHDRVYGGVGPPKRMWGGAANDRTWFPSRRAGPDLRRQPDVAWSALERRARPCISGPFSASASTSTTRRTVDAGPYPRGFPGFLVLTRPAPAVCRWSLAGH